MRSWFQNDIITKNYVIYTKSKNGGIKGTWWVLQFFSEKLGMDLGQPTGGRQAGYPTSGGSHQLTKVSWISHLTACNWGVQGADSPPHSLGIASWYFAN